MTQPWSDRPVTQIPDHFGDVGPGWRPILEQLHGSILALDPCYNVTQVKEKFGSLRVYLAYCAKEITPIIRAAEVLSASTCEECGGAGHIRQRPGRYRMQCLCDVCVSRPWESPW